MRFLALETNIGKLKKQFIAEGEEELLTTKQHIFRFLSPMFWVALLTVLLLLVESFLAAAGIIDPIILGDILGVWVLVATVLTLRAVINWRFNTLVITTEKIVLIHHDFLFHQEIRPIHLENIRSTQTETQFFGVGHCGSLHVSLQETTSGTSGQVTVSYLPKPEVIVGAIENAIVLKKQRAPADKGPEGQEGKVQEIKEKTAEEIQQS